jgi:hypothetical protein
VGAEEKRSILSKNFARYQRARMPVVLTLWRPPSWEALSQMSCMQAR